MGVSNIKRKRFAVRRKIVRTGLQIPEKAVVRLSRLCNGITSKLRIYRVWRSQC